MLNKLTTPMGNTLSLINRVLYTRHHTSMRISSSVLHMGFYPLKAKDPNLCVGACDLFIETLIQQNIQTHV